jgi:phosphoribosylcarboxyaminoimidazole (NCAIR) mutase
MTSLEPEGLEPPAPDPEVAFDELPVDAPRVGIVMSAKSEPPTMQKAEQELNDRGIRSEVRVMSAHHDPDVVADYARNARLATVGVDAAKNAAVLAARILSL